MTQPWEPREASGGETQARRRRESHLQVTAPGVWLNGYGYELDRNWERCAPQQKIKKEKKERKRFNEEMLNKINSNRNGKLFHLPAHPQNTFENRLTLPKGNNEKRTTYGLINRSCKAKRGEECK